MRYLEKVLVLVAFLMAPVLATHVAVLETIAGKDVLSLEEKQYLTDVLRSEAVKALPAEMNFTIMTRDNIQMMLPPGKGIEDCEGSCLVETGKNIAADYIAQGRVGRFGASLTITVELYETAGNKLMGSFTAKSNDIEQLEIEIRQKAKPLFAKARGNTYSGPSFATGIASAPKSVALKIQTVPMGASVAIDGRPSKCMSTPCTVNIAEGEHRVLVAADDYKDKDTVMYVEGEEMTLKMDLDPNFGQLNLVPGYNESDTTKKLVVTIDGRTSRNDVAFKKGFNNLPAGVHAVELSHPCYEPVKFNVGISIGKTEKFDQPLKLAKGWISLKTQMNGADMKVPVWLDGEKAGETPYQAEIPLCSKIEVGEGVLRNDVEVELKLNANVEVVHQLHRVEKTPDEMEKQLQEEKAANDAAAKKQAQASEAAKDAAPKDGTAGKIMKPVSIALMVLGAAGLGVGVYENFIVADERDTYDKANFKNQAEADDQWDKVKSAGTLRNVFYGVGGALLGVGAVLFFVF